MQDSKTVRPRLFVASSKESLDYAYAIPQNLDDDAEVTVWKQGVFELTKTTIENLLKALDRFDFAVFVFAPNDTLRIRQSKYKAIRDNVVFELGLFMGKPGRERTFIVVPKGTSDLRIPSDLAGVTPGTFDPKRKDKNLEAAFGPFCNQVRTQIRRSTRANNSKVKKSPTAVKTELFVVDATYGAQNHRIDVAKQLNKAIENDKLRI